MTEKIGSAVKAGSMETVQKQEKPVGQTSSNILYKPNGHAELYYLLRDAPLSEFTPNPRNEEIVKYDYIDTDTGEVVHSRILF